MHNEADRAVQVSRRKIIHFCINPFGNSVEQR
jgi:hypothetical protein